MKKIIFIISFVVICLCGCSNKDKTGDSVAAFTLSAEVQDNYESEINAVLNNFYWRYDENSILFFKEMLPSKKDGDEIYSASDEAGYSLVKFAGDEAVVSTVNLMHFNGEKAGVCYFYFIKGNMQGVYYTADGTNKVYSITNRNVFERTADFKGFESNKPMDGFKTSNISFSTAGFASEYKDYDKNSKFLSIGEAYVKVYVYKSYMSIDKSLAFNDGLVPLSATFFDGGKIAVLLGKNVYAETEKDIEITGTTSEKVAFYDENYNLIGERILDSAGYSCVACIEDKLVLFQDNAAEFYDFKDNELAAVNQIFIDHRVTAFKSDDIDGDGTEEYIMTDGMDLYLYHKNEVSFVGLWQTHLGINSLSGYIYTGDLNKDGIKEVYICDSTGTTIRYTLTEKGFKSMNDDIVYGEMIFASDFNNDGYDDYIDCTLGDVMYNFKMNIAVK